MNDVPLEKKHGQEWLDVARDAFEASTTYFDANHRRPFERNIALFQSKHPSGSKYLSPAFKSRSRLFRPKTKSFVRKNEAAASAAFFANVDVVTCEAENAADPMQAMSAELMNEVINYRLSKTIPWYITVLGALQDAQVIGVVGSYQYWHYKEKPTQVPVTDDMGQPLTDEKGATYMQEGPPEVLIDKPCIELMPVENYRFDPSADWTDPVNSSPYFIRLVPMYLDDVKQRMKEDDPKTGAKRWKKLEDGEIRTAMAEYDTLRQAREAPKQDPLGENQAPMKEYEVVWCHENFVRLNGEEKVYWTLGTSHMLTDPVALKEAYFHGERPFVIGFAVLETHKAIPESLVGIGSELQKEANETVNQRRDNVSLVLNKRYIVKRGASVDTDSLLRNVPGGVTLANDPELDIKEMNWPDVTSSAYQEQDRINVDMDELVGNFSQSSVQTNRKLNETVGGMQMMGGAASQMTEYLLRVFVETWMEPVLRQLVKIEQAYETDTVVLALAGSKAKLQQRYGINQVTDDMLNGSMTLSVNVGMGATDPHAKIGKLMLAVKTFAEASQVQGLNTEELGKQIFGLAGYKNGEQFLAPSGPNQELMQKMQEMQQALQEAQQKAQQAEAAAMKASVQLAAKQGELQVAAFDAQTKRLAAMKGEPTPDNSFEIQSKSAELRLAASKQQGDHALQAKKLEDEKQLKQVEQQLKAAELNAEQAVRDADAALKRAQVELVQAQTVAALATAGATASEETMNKATAQEGEARVKQAEANQKMAEQKHTEMMGALKETHKTQAEILKHLSKPRVSTITVAKRPDGSFAGEKVES